MKKITSLFIYNKVVDGVAKAMVCINGNTAANSGIFVSAKWLAQESKLPIHLLSLLIGSNIDVTFYAKDEVMVAEVLDGKTVVTEAKLCTTDGKVVKSFTIELGFNLMCAMLKAA